MRLEGQITWFLPTEGKEERGPLPRQRPPEAFYPPRGRMGGTDARQRRQGWPRDGNNSRERVENGSGTSGGPGPLFRGPRGPPNRPDSATRRQIGRKQRPKCGIRREITVEFAEFTEKKAGTALMSA